MRICFIGDSFVNGTGDPECLGWAGRICAEARRAGRDLTCYNLGIRRDTSRCLARRWQQEAACRLPDGEDGRLVFSFGVNDCVIEGGCQRVAPAETLAHAAAMLGQATRWRPTVVVGPPPIAEPEINGRIGALSTELGRLCAGLHVPYLEVFPALASSAVWMEEVAAGDGAHPRAGGYAVLAQIVGRWAVWQGWVSQGA
ncbi:MAG: GDSL-type esterase/lipase family protein [Solirubrobacterales bacterium]